MIMVEAAVESESKKEVVSTLLGIPPFFDLRSFDFLSPVLISNCVEYMSLYGIGLYAMGDAAIAETVRVVGVLKTSVGVGVIETSRG